MGAQERQVLEKPASAACADMYDDIDTVIGIEKTSRAGERQVQYTIHSVYSAEEKFALPPDVLRTALCVHNASTARPTCKRNINDTQRKLSYCYCPLRQSFSPH